MNLKNLPHTVQVAVGIPRAVIVDHNVDTLNIDTTTKDIGGYENTLLEGFERSVARDTEMAMSDC
jgi:hypothetical protein